jgi:uncharacterized protein DUF3618
MTESSAQLEHELEQTRERLITKLEELRAQITPGEVIDQIVDYAREGGAGEFLRSLSREVRHNPVPLTLMSIAVIWLLLEGRRHSHRNDADFRQRIDDRGHSAERFAAGLQGAARMRAADAERAAEDIGDAYRDQLTGNRRRTRAAADRITRGAMSAASSIGDAGRQARQRLAHLRDHAASAGDTAGLTYQRAADSTADVAQQVTDTISAITQSTTTATRRFVGFCAGQPVVLAGIGLAVGAALGAVFAKTIVRPGHESAAGGTDRQELRPQDVEQTTIVPGG